MFFIYIDQGVLSFRLIGPRLAEMSIYRIDVCIVEEEFLIREYVLK